MVTRNRWLFARVVCGSRQKRLPRQLVVKQGMVGVVAECGGAKGPCRKKG